MLKRKISKLEHKYDPENDVIQDGNLPNFNYIDAELLDLISWLADKVEKLEAEVKSLKGDK